MPLEEAEGSPAPQGSQGPQGQRGSPEQLACWDLPAPRAPRGSQAEARWWATMATSARRSRKSAPWPSWGLLVFPGKQAHLVLQGSQARRGRSGCQAPQDLTGKRGLEADQETQALPVPKVPPERLGLQESREKMDKWGAQEKRGPRGSQARQAGRV